jgi:hypothetical protein
MTVNMASKILQVQFALDGDTFDGSNNTITVSGLRTSCVVNSYNGSIGSFASNLSLSISGMANRDMAKLSTLGFSSGIYNKNLITVSAGDSLSSLVQVFAGGITYGNADYNAMPQARLDIVASAMASLQFAPVAASSFQGTLSVAAMIEAVGKACNPPMACVNNGVTATLSNHAVGGSGVDQIEDICQASGTQFKIANGPSGQPTIYLWPQGSTADAQVVSVNGSTGMIGYPTYSFRGLDVRSYFNPQLEIGRQVMVTSTTPPPAANAPQQTPGMGPSPGASGTFYVWGVTHNLSSETVNGPWETMVNLGNNNTSARG